MPRPVIPHIAVNRIIALGDWPGRARSQREQTVFKQILCALEMQA